MITRSRFFTKLFVGSVTLIVFTAVVIGLLGARRVREVSLAEIERTLASDTSFLLESISGALASGDHARIQERVRRLGRATRKRLTVMNPSGDVLADSAEAPFRMDNHGGRPEVVAAIRTRATGTSARFSRTVRKEMMYVARAAFDGDELRGVVRASQSLEMIEDRIPEFSNTLIIGSAIAALVACALAWFFARRVTGPIETMREAATAMAAGDYRRRARVLSDDELGTLGEAFNSMAAQLEERVEAMRQEQAKLHSILTSMLEGVVATDREERVVHLNDVAASILDIDPEEALDRPLWQVTRFPKIGDTLARTIETGAPSTIEVLVPENGSDRIVRIYSSALRHTDDSVTGAVLVLHDVSELRKLEKVRRDFVSNVSHELKTPLTAIRGMIETMLDDHGMPHDTRTRFLSRVHSQVERLSNLVTDLLNLSRVESAADPEQESIDLRAPVELSVRHLHVEAEQKDIDVRLELPPEAVVVRGDQEALRQVVDNLLQNAIRYTPGGGRIEVRLRSEDSHAVLEVEDTGIGIEPRHHDRVFERFYRVDKARSRELGGTGLGLSIVKHVTLSHGGEVSVDSAPGRGSTFRVRLPLHGVA